MAETKDMINLKDAYDDPRFNAEIDMKTGYKTNAMLSMPICNYEGDVIGVAQIINKTNGKYEQIEQYYYCNKKRFERVLLKMHAVRDRYT